MEKNDLVSVVIPIYNSEKFLAQCIESILNQSYKNIEIIAVNDGSTDTSFQILKKYSDKITIVSQQNQGLASALNSGIKVMKGKWFKWFSPDDILYPQAIETLIKKGQELGENCIVYSNWEIIDENNKHLRNFSESNYNDLEKFDFNIRLLDGQQINVNTSIIPANLFEEGCIFHNLEDPVLVDYDFFLRAGILYNIRFYLIEKFLVQYRINKSQLSHKSISKSLSNLNKIRESFLKRLDYDTRENLEFSLKDYQKRKPFTKKSMEFSLKIIKKTLPEKINDNILLIYLNKIRRTR